jgi:hypothetical protein
MGDKAHGSLNDHLTIEGHANLLPTPMQHFLKSATGPIRQKNEESMGRHQPLQGRRKNELTLLNIPRSLFEVWIFGDSMQ